MPRRVAWPTAWLASPPDQCVHGGMIDFAYKIAGFLVTLGVLVVFHELGHYIVARWCGVKVLRFSVGLRPRHRGAPGRPRPDRVGAVGDSARRLREDGRRARRRRRAAPTSRARSIARACGSASRSSRPVPIANLLLAVVLFAGTYMAGIPGQRARARRAARRRRRRPRRACAAAISSSRSTASRCKSWQDLRWRLSARAGPRQRDALGRCPRDARRGRSAGDAHAGARPASAGRLGRQCARGARACAPISGAPLIGEVVPGKPGARAGLGQGRPHRRHRRRRRALARRRRAVDQRAAGRAARVPRRARRRDAATSR